MDGGEKQRRKEGELKSSRSAPKSVSQSCFAFSCSSWTFLDAEVFPSKKMNEEKMVVHIRDAKC